MNAPKINRELLRKKAIARGIPTFTALASLVPCSRPTVYFALENPTRYPRVIRRIKELTR